MRRHRLAMSFAIIATLILGGVTPASAGPPGAPADLAALIAYNRADPLERTCFEGQELFEQSQAVPGPDDPGYQAPRWTPSVSTPTPRPLRSRPRWSTAKSSSCPIVPAYSPGRSIAVGVTQGSRSTE